MDGVVILGAGLAGLGCARSLPGARVFEAKDHPGGKAYSHRIDGVCFDEGAHISHTKNREFLSLIQDQARHVEHIQQSRVSNFWHGLWLTYPVQNHLKELPVEMRVQALSDLVMAHLNSCGAEPVDYRDWCLNQYGKYLSDNFYKEFTEKYWRVNMQELATDWIKGRLLPSAIRNVIRSAFLSQTESQASFSSFHYPSRGGFFRFFQALYDSIDVEYGEEVIEIDLNAKSLTTKSGRQEHYEVVANSIPLPELVAVIKDAPPSVRDAAALLRHTKHLCVNMVVRQPSLAKYHWCYIYDHEIPPARVWFPSNLSPSSVGTGICALQAEVFRRSDEAWDVDALTEITVKEMVKLFRLDADSEIVAISRLVLPYAYVISDLNRGSAVQHILSWLKQHAVYSMGLYGQWKYMWSDAAYYSGVEAAKEIKEMKCHH